MLVNYEEQLLSRRHRGIRDCRRPSGSKIIRWSSGWRDGYDDGTAGVRPRLSHAGHRVGTHEYRYRIQELIFNLGGR